MSDDPRYNSPLVQAGYREHQERLLDIAEAPETHKQTFTVTFEYTGYKADVIDIEGLSEQLYHDYEDADGFEFLDNVTVREVPT